MSLFFPYLRRTGRFFLCVLLTDSFLIDTLCWINVVWASRLNVYSTTHFHSVSIKTKFRQLGQKSSSADWEFGKASWHNLDRRDTTNWETTYWEAKPYQRDHQYCTWHRNAWIHVLRFSFWLNLFWVEDWDRLAFQGKEGVEMDLICCVSFLIQGCCPRRHWRASNCFGRNPHNNSIHHCYIHKSTPVPWRGSPCRSDDIQSDASAPSHHVGNVVHTLDTAVLVSSPKDLKTRPVDRRVLDNSHSGNPSGIFSYCRRFYSLDSSFELKFFCLSYFLDLL